MDRVSSHHLATSRVFPEAQIFGNFPEALSAHVYPVSPDDSAFPTTSLAANFSAELLSCFDHLAHLT
jgi:hypothetical protein